VLLSPLSFFLPSDRSLGFRCLIACAPLHSSRVPFSHSIVYPTSPLILYLCPFLMKCDRSFFGIQRSLVTASFLGTRLRGPHFLSPDSWSCFEAFILAFPPHFPFFAPFLFSTANLFWHFCRTDRPVSLSFRLLNLFPLSPCDYFFYSILSGLACWGNPLTCEDVFLSRPFPSALSTNAGTTSFNLFRFFSTDYAFPMIHDWRYIE